MIYLDHAASMPVRPQVIDEMVEVLRACPGNPSSDHAAGRAAAAVAERARARVAAAIGAAPEEIVFTSGATEANNLALIGGARFYTARGRHLVSARTEHKSVIDTCRRLQGEGWRLDWLRPDQSGRISPQALAGVLREDTALVSLMLVNNETGVINDLDALGAICRERGVLLHSDAAQALGRCALDLRRLPVDMLSLSGHKIGGPQGVGALYLRQQPRARVLPLMSGGGQERGLRPGTLAVHQLAGFGLACELAAAEREAEQRRLHQLRAALWSALEAALPDIHHNGGIGLTVGNILCVSFGGVDGESLRADLPDLAVARGSACTSGANDPSYVLRALGRSDDLAAASLRFSFGPDSSSAEVAAAAERVIAAVRRLRALAPAA